MAVAAAQDEAVMIIHLQNLCDLSDLAVDRTFTANLLVLPRSPKLMEFR
jgi:hypothetical protein